MGQLKQFLRNQGVQMTEAEFLDLTRDAFRAALGETPPVPGMLGLPEAERVLLDSGGFFEKAAAVERQDPLFWGAIDYAAIIATALSTAEVAEMLEVDTSRIRQRLTSERPSLYGVKPYGEWLLPKFQFWKQREVPGIAKVIRELDPSLNPVSVISWFKSTSPDLVTSNGEASSPLEWLKAGYAVDDIVRLAAAL